MFNKEKIKELYPEAENLMIEPMKIWKLPAGKETMLSEICTNGQYFLEEKIDGAFYQFVKTPNYSYLFGRTVSVTTNLLTEKSANIPHIIQALEILPPNTIIIGEIYYPGKTSKDVVSIMGCLADEAIKRQIDNPIHYYVHDILKYDGVSLIDCGAEERYNILAAAWKYHSLDKFDFLRLAVKIEENLEEEISRILNSGGEGAVLKKRNFPYSPGKRPAWSTIKIKQMDSVDLVCMGFCPPTKEYTGKDINTWMYWEEIMSPRTLFEGRYRNDNGDILIKTPMQPITKYYYLGWNTAIRVGAYNEQGELVELGTVSSGLTDDMKRLMTEFPGNFLGKVVSLDCMSIDRKEHTLRHPVLKTWRLDKDAKECLIEEVFA